MPERHLPLIFQEKMSSELIISWTSCFLCKHTNHYTIQIQLPRKAKIFALQNKGKESENSYQKLKRSWWTGTRKHTVTKSTFFDEHGHLSQSKEGECMWTHDKDERQPCPSKYFNISILLPCVFLCLTSAISSIFGKSFHFVHGVFRAGGPWSQVMSSRCFASTCGRHLQRCCFNCCFWSDEGWLFFFLVYL